MASNESYYLWIVDSLPSQVALFHLFFNNLRYGSINMDYVTKYSNCDICNFDHRPIGQVLKIIEELNQLTDVDSILDHTLLQSRLLSKADAGSIFLIEDGALHFSYVQNNTVFKNNQTNVALYADVTVAINDKSIVGYAALTGKSIVIDDAYNLSAGVPYSFNTSFDSETGYKTTSVYTLPLKTFQNKTVGVIQLINAMDSEHNVVPFDLSSQNYLTLLSNNASVVIERGILTRELVLRMMKMAELRDPAETGAHVRRVGAFAAEIYHKWALNKGIRISEIKKYKDLLRLAAMLHDVGKVGIPDVILKKPAKLTKEEYDIMKHHAVFGARLFSNTTSDLDKMSMEIALNHHEKWNGMGYPGLVKELETDGVGFGPGKKEQEIPISARITALADVYDALSSRRCYKEPWSEDKVLNVIREEKGKHFDPEIVDAFFETFDVIKAIQQKYQ